MESGENYLRVLSEVKAAIYMEFGSAVSVVSFSGTLHVILRVRRFHTAMCCADAVTTR